MTLEYYPGSDAPAYGEAIVDGRRVVLDCRALTGAAIVPKLQAIFTPPKSSGREFDLKDAARWGHHEYLGELWRELPDFVPSSSAMRSERRHGERMDALGLMMNERHLDQRIGREAVVLVHDGDAMQGEG